MLQRVALHQARFRTPGVGPDTRRVVVGQRGLFLFPSLDRLVMFLRGYAEQGSLDELLPGLAIHTARTPLGTHEVVLSVQAESSQRMDRLAEVARLARGLVFTGTQRHFVKYRDADSPLGYDVDRLADEPADLVVYHDTFQQTYRYERPIPLRDLILRLTPQPVPPSERTTPARLLATAPPGVGEALVSYLARAAIRARVAHVAWASASPFDEDAAHAHLFELEHAPDRITRLLAGLPGVHVFVPAGDRAAVELGRRHPIPLESCRTLFEDNTLHLMRADGRVLRVAPAPTFVSLASVVRVPLLDAPAEPVRGAGGQPDSPLAIPLHVVPGAGPVRPPVAAVVPRSQAAWLGRLLYALPPRTLGSLRMAFGPQSIYLLSEEGLEGIPLGTSLWRFAPRAYLPSGHTFSPAVGPAALEDLLTDRGEGHWFFAAEGPPTVVADASFAPASRRALATLRGEPAAADAPTPPDIPLPLLEYGPPRRLPLWGVPGKDEGAREDGG